MSVNPTVCTEVLAKRSAESDIPLTIGMDGADPLFSGVLPSGVTIISPNFHVPDLSPLVYDSLAVVADPDTSRADAAIFFNVSFGDNETTYRIEIDCICSDGATRQAAIDIVVRD